MYRSQNYEMVAMISSLGVIVTIVLESEKKIANGVGVINVLNLLTLMFSVTAIGLT